MKTSFKQWSTLGDQSDCWQYRVFSSLNWRNGSFHNALCLSLLNRDEFRSMK